MNYVMQSPLKLFALLIALTFALAACSTTATPQGKETAPYYVASVDIDSNANQAEIEKMYGGQAVIFKPEAGFAILGFSKEAGELTTLSTDLNQNALSSPEAHALGNSAWASGYSVWASGYSVWASGYSAWASGLLAWNGGTASLPELPAGNRLAFNLMKLPQGQAIARNFGDGVKVAVIDTGIDLNHPLFSGRLAPSNEWKDFVDNDTSPQEVTGTYYGHGTGAAGLVVQVAPKAIILPIRVLNSDGSGDVDKIVSAIDWAIQKGAKVINLSLGTTTNVAALQSMVNYATSQGIYITASSGNTGDSNVTYPAAWAKSGSNSKYLLSVGSISDAFLLSIFSCSGNSLEFVAPGELITSAYPDNRVAQFTGTSFAAPIVAGTIALGLSDVSNSNKGNLEAYLNASNTPIPFTNYGLVNVAGFLQQSPTFQARQALLVAGSTSLNSADSAIKSRLEGLGYAITVKDAKKTSSSDANGKNLVLISSTISSSSVGTTFRDVSVPVLVWEQYLFDDMEMTSSSGNGTDAGETKVSIVDSNHPLAAGLSNLFGSLTVFSSSDDMTYGEPSSSASKIATIYDNSSRATIFGYDTGAQMVGMVAPSRRVGFYLNNDGASKLTLAGWQLFEAAITWAVTGN